MMTAACALADYPTDGDGQPASIFEIAKDGARRNFASEGHVHTIALLKVPLPTGQVGLLSVLPQFSPDRSGTVIDAAVMSLIREIATRTRAHAAVFVSPARCCPVPLQMREAAETMTMTEEQQATLLHHDDSQDAILVICDTGSSVAAEVCIVEADEGARTLGPWADAGEIVGSLGRLLPAKASA